MKKYLFGTLAIAVAVGVSAFTTKKAKPFVAQSFYYIQNSDYQRVEPRTPAQDFGVPVEGKSMVNDPNYNSANTSNFENTNNWSTTAADAGTSPTIVAYNTGTPDGSSYVWKFTVDQFDADTDGYADGAASLEEALKELELYHVSNSNLPTSTFTIPGTSITISSIVKSEDRHY